MQNDLNKPAIPCTDLSCNHDMHINSLMPTTTTLVETAIGNANEPKCEGSIQLVAENISSQPSDLMQQEGGIGNDIVLCKECHEIPDQSEPVGSMECGTNSSRLKCYDNFNMPSDDGLPVVDSYVAVENEQVDSRNPVNGKVLSLTMDFLENNVGDDNDDLTKPDEPIKPADESWKNGTNESYEDIKSPVENDNTPNDSYVNGKLLSNDSGFTTVLGINGHETTFYDNNDTHPSTSPNKDIPLRILTLHYKSVSTSTEDIKDDNILSTPVSNEECQCYPEEFLTDDQELPFQETYIDLDDDDDAFHDDSPQVTTKLTTNSSKGTQNNISTSLPNMTKLDIIKMRQDLLKALVKIQAFESNLKTMRAEKLDLLGQMKHLYATLENKEEDFNSFVKSFEIKISEGNEFISRLITEKNTLEKANQDLEMKLQNTLDQCVSLTLDLDLKNQVIEQMNLQLENSQVSCSDSNLSTNKADVSMVTNFPRSSVSQDRQKEIHKDPIKGSSSKTTLSLNEVLQIHISQWKANHVLIWLEQDLNMGCYGEQCRENVKSGKILLTMTDHELDSAFGLQSPIHRKKLRVAIDHLNNPKLREFPLADGLTTDWIAGEWLKSLGLPQFGPVFEAQLVDGRILKYLTGKELEKNFTMISKTHISSMLAAIQLLKIFQFDKKKLEEQRQVPDKQKHGCLLWTNADVIEWLKEIDLQEYATNLNKSGIHGALLVLDDRFTVDHLAAEMGLPVTKSYLMRHLSQEYEDVVGPARSKVNNSLKLSSKADRMRTLSRTSSSSSSKTKREDFFSSTLSFKGSLGRAFGRKMKKELIQVVPTPEPVRMSTGLLSLFDSPSLGENNNLNYNETIGAADLSNTSFSAFSSLHSLTLPGTTPSKSSANDAVVSATFSPVAPLESVEKSREGRLSTSPASEVHKSKTPKNNKYFTLRAFSANSRSRNAGGSVK